MDEGEGEWQVATAKKSRDRWFQQYTLKTSHLLQEPKRENRLHTNRFASLHLPEPFRFDALPPELRNQTYDILRDHIDITLYRLQDPEVSEQWRGIACVASRHRATDIYTDILLTNRQIYGEMQSRYCSGDFSTPVENTLSGPRVYPTQTEREEAIFANARSWQLQGYLHGFGSVDDRADYVVGITFGRREPGYGLAWRHMSVEVGEGGGVTESMYAAMVSRVERAFVAALAEREKVDRRRRLTLDSARKVIDAFYFNGREFE